MKLYVKYMVNVHHKKAVKDELKRLGIHYIIDDTGVVDVMENITSKQHKQIRTALLRSGLELMDNKKAIIIEKIKSVIIEMVRFMDDLTPANYPGYLSKRLKYDYHFLEILFSEGLGTTIEKFITGQKIERVKELLIYEDCSNKAVARMMNYGTVAHLSSNFKINTGLTLSHFRNLENKRRILSEDARNLYRLQT